MDNKKQLSSELQRMGIKLRKERLQLSVLQNEVKNLSYKKITLTEDVAKLEETNSRLEETNKQLVKERDKIAQLNNVKKDQVIVDSLDTTFGMSETTGYAKVYPTKEEAMKNERNYILKRNKLYIKIISFSIKWSRYGTI